MSGKLKMVIMQGLPGGGKGFVRKRDYPDGIVATADDYFRRLNPNYDNGGEGFSPSFLGEAHKSCFAIAHSACMNGYDTVVIDNTNLENEAIAPYVALANLFGYDVEICRVVCDPNIAAGRNTHGVPAKAYPRMAAAFDRWKMWSAHKFGGVTLKVVQNG